MLRNICNKKTAMKGEKIFFGIARTLSSDICQTTQSEVVKKQCKN